MRSRTKYLVLAAAAALAVAMVIWWRARREGLTGEGGAAGTGGGVAAPSGGAVGQPDADWTEEGEAEMPSVSVDAAGYKTLSFSDGKSFKFKDPQIGKKLDAAGFNINAYLRDNLAKYGEDGMSPDQVAWWQKYGPSINWNTTEFDMPGSGRTLAGMWAENQKVYDDKVRGGWQPDYGPGDAGRPPWETQAGVQASTPYSGPGGGQDGGEGDGGDGGSRAMVAAGGAAGGGGGRGRAMSAAGGAAGGAMAAGGLFGSKGGGGGGGKGRGKGNKGKGKGKGKGGR